MVIELRKYPGKDDLIWMRQCTVGTMGKDTRTPPTSEFVRKLLVARHSPIRELRFSYVIRDVPYWVTVHLVRHHVGFQPYVQSQRNDRQNDYDPETREVVQRMCALAEQVMPELKGLLVPMCEYHGGICHEIQSCGRTVKVNE